MAAGSTHRDQPTAKRRFDTVTPTAETIARGARPRHETPDTRSAWVNTPDNRNPHKRSRRLDSEARLDVAEPPPTYARTPKRSKLSGSGDHSMVELALLHDDTADAAV